MNEISKDLDVLSSFGLNERQLSYLFSLERLITLNDIENSIFKKNIKLEKEWLDHWCKNLQTGQNVALVMSRTELVKRVKVEYADSNSKTWYHLMILEAIAFRPYFSLGGNEDNNDKAYSNLNFNSQLDFIKKFVEDVGGCSEDTVERYAKMYKRAIEIGSGRRLKTLTNILIITATVAVTTATAGAFAGPIAVYLFGAQFAGLKGAALVSACLAFAGGGAIAAGGAGMAGGVIAIVGGGALLGVAGGGAAVLGRELMKQSPEYAFTQAAKLNVVLREIILNEQQDILVAQQVLKKYRDQIAEMQKVIKSLELENKDNKEQIKNLKKALEYMERIYKDSQKFSSSYDVGIFGDK